VALGEKREQRAIEGENPSGTALICQNTNHHFHCGFKCNMIEKSSMASSMATADWSKNSMFSVIDYEARRRGMSLYSIAKSRYSSEDVFCIVKGQERAFGKLIENHQTGIRYHGIQQTLFKFFSLNKHKSFIIFVDPVENQYITIPFALLEPFMFDRKGTDGKGNQVTTHMDFHVSKLPYYIMRKRVHPTVSMEKYTNKLDALFHVLA
jgi:hypothetical protein